MGLLSTTLFLGHGAAYIWLTHGGKRTVIRVEL